MKKLIFVFWVLTQSIYGYCDTRYPELMLENKEFKVNLYLPDAEQGYYRGSRFDWSGIIKQVKYAGHRFYGPLHETHDPYGHDFVSGPAEEFAMYNPMGFSEAKAGESFVKIGVGLLRKGQSEEYLFHQTYELIRAGEWQIEHGASWVTFTQNFVGERGWAYRYVKSIKLVPGHAAFIIEHQLENTGEKTIDIDNYNHNFTIIDDVPYGVDYSVEFPFISETPKPINNLAWFRDNRIDVEQPLLKKSLWIPVFQGGASADYNAATIRNNKTGAAVKFKGDSPISHMIFWAVERAACPEPFISIKLASGQDKKWSSHYSFIVDKK